MQARFHYVKCPLAPKTRSKENDKTSKRSKTPASTQALHHCPRCLKTPCPVLAAESHESNECEYCILQKAPAQIFKNQICLLISLDPQDPKLFKKELVSSFDKRNTAYLDVVKELQGCLKPTSAGALDMRSILLRTAKFRKPLISDRCPFGNGDLALISSLWDDQFVSVRSFKVNKKRRKFIKDEFLHRQYCIVIRGIDSFTHLFKPKGSMENAKQLLASETDFFKRFLEGDESNSIAQMMRKLSFLKSVFNDAALNYPDANDVLACWRGIVGENEEFGYTKLLKFEDAFVSTCLSAPPNVSSNNQNTY
jgi:hypothetical protein